MEFCSTPVDKLRVTRILCPTELTVCHPATTNIFSLGISATAFEALVPAKDDCQVQRTVPVEDTFTANAFWVPPTMALPTNIWEASDAVIPWTAWGSSKEDPGHEDGSSALSPVNLEAAGADSRL